MKILHLISSLKIGGAESILVSFLKHIPKKQQYKHVVACFHSGPNVGQLRALGIQVYVMRGAVSPYDFLALFRLIKLIRTQCPDIIHSSLWSANIIGSILSFLFRIPLICDLHSDPSYHGWFRNTLERALVRVPQRFIAVSKSVRNAFEREIVEKSFFGRMPTSVLAKKLVVIPNAIDVQGVVAKSSAQNLMRKEVGLPPHAFVIGSVGRLEPIKRYDVLLEAFAILVKSPQSAMVQDSLHLCMVGGGSDRTRLDEMAGMLGISENVLFMGEHIDAVKFYPLFDCFALSSATEGLSIALLEALCFGLPIVSTHSEGEHDVLVNGVHGLLIPPGNLQALAGALERLFRDKALRQQMSQHNKNLAGERFHISHLVASYESLYQDVCL